MSHTTHLDSQGLKLPSVSAIPGIFAQDISGFEDWICRALHTKEEKCCIRAKRQFYQESANLGNDIHQLMEAFLRGESFEEGVPEYQAAVFDPVAKFLKESGYRALDIPNSDETTEPAIELKLTGKEIGGTLDTAGTFTNLTFTQPKRFWANLPNKEHIEPAHKDVWIVDLKIKSKLDALHPLQLYGYSLLLKEIYGIKSYWGLIVRREKKLDKTPEIQLKGYFLPAYKEIWDAAMLLWHFLND